MAMPLNQERVYFLLDAARDAGERTEGQIIEDYMAKFDVGRVAAETAIVRELRVGHIGMDGHDGHDGPDGLRTAGLAITELGGWWLLARGKPIFGQILLIRRELLEQVRAGRLRILILEAMDDEIRRIVSTDLEQAIAPPDNP